LSKIKKERGEPHLRAKFEEIDMDGGGSKILFEVDDVEGGGSKISDKMLIAGKRC
jgi:hypothetical protein